MTSLNLDRLEVRFDPPPWRKPTRRRRAVTLMTDRGVLLGGITVHYPKRVPERIEIPESLPVLNRPEYGEEPFPLTDLDREALRNLIQEKLRYRPEENYPPECSKPGESVSLLRKARAARSARKN